MATTKPTVITCTVCSDDDELKYNGKIGERMRAHLVCFSCAFWQALIEQDASDPENVVIVNGSHYLIRPDLAPHKPKFLAGFGGTRWDIRFLDGHQVVSHNLWAQGVIPERWRGALPDNARFG